MDLMWICLWFDMDLMWCDGGGGSSDGGSGSGGGSGGGGGF